MDIAFDDLTKSARQAIELAYQHAGRRQAPNVEPEHLLLGVLGAPSEPTSQALVALQIDQHQVGRAIEAQLALSQTTAERAPTMAPETLHIIQYANNEARLLGHPRTDTIHLLLGLLYEGGRPAAAALEQAGLSLFDLRQVAMKLSKRVEVRREGGLRDALSISPVFLVPLGLTIAAGLGLYMDPAKLYVTPLTIVFIVCGWITSVCVHEFGHALAAYLGGDLSVKDKGYLTLNPLKYTHTLFSIVLPLLYLMIGGSRPAGRRGLYQHARPAQQPLGDDRLGGGADRQRALRSAGHLAILLRLGALDHARELAFLAGAGLSWFSGGVRPGVQLDPAAAARRVRDHCAAPVAGDAPASADVRQPGAAAAVCDAVAGRADRRHVLRARFFA